MSEEKGTSLIHLLPAEWQRTRAQSRPPEVVITVSVKPCPPVNE